MPQNNTTNINPTKLNVVGIGVSEGGLDALKTFFSLISSDSGLAYIIVEHDSSEYNQPLAELLGPLLNIPIHQVTQTVALEANHTYVIPPTLSISTIDSQIRVLKQKSSFHTKAPIDHFFAELAKKYQTHAIGIILSGNSLDGTLGIKAIKEQDGLSIVQDPHEVSYDSMPESAISGGLVDLILPLKKIPPYIHHYVSSLPAIDLASQTSTLSEHEKQLIEKILMQVKASTGRDFKSYKQVTLVRRLLHRLQLHQINRLEVYFEMLVNNDDEAQALADDFLINISSFFRDKKVYQTLEQDIIPKIFDAKKPGERLRVWSIGCATGEEAYSLAMLLKEEADRREVVPEIQLIASDIHEPSLKKAQEGFYTGEIESEVSEERLCRFFSKEFGGYRIRNQLRELVIFTHHDLLNYPFFSHIDLIVCRNLLIHLKRKTHQKIFRLFHHAIQADGFLVLGQSESINNTSLFDAINKKLSIYRIQSTANTEFNLPIFPLQLKPTTAEPIQKNDDDSLQYEALHQKLISNYAPPSLLINPRNKVVHKSNTADRYLISTEHKPGNDLFKLIHAELLVITRTTIFNARKKKQTIRSKPIQITIDGQLCQLIVSARPAEDVTKENYILLMFKEFVDGKPLGIKQSYSSTDVSDQLTKIKALEEELQSANESLQASLEELEISREEQQSLREELNVINQENIKKKVKLSQMSDDLQNLLTASDIAILVLDKELRIQRFTPSLAELFNLRPSDHGKHISEQLPMLGNHKFVEATQKVFKRLVPIEREIQDLKGNIYSTKTLPYRNSENQIEGAIITFVDISAQKKAEEEQRQSTERYNSLFDSIDEGFCIIEMIFDQNGKAVDYKFLEVNPVFERHTGLKNAAGKSMRELEPRHEEHWFETYGKIALSGIPERFSNEAKHLGGRWFDVYAFRVGNPQERKVAVLFKDITHQKKSEEALHRSETHLSLIFHEAEAGISEISTEGKFLRVNEKLCRILGRTREELLTLGVADVTLPEYLPGSQQALLRLIQTGNPESIDKCYIQPDGTKVWANSALSLLTPQNDEPPTILAVTIDLTKQRNAEHALFESEKRYRNLFEFIDEGFCIIELMYDEHNKPYDFYILEANPAIEKQIGMSKIVGKTALELSPLQEFFWIEIYSKVAISGEPQRFSAKANNLKKWFDVYAFRVEKPEEHRVAILTSDVTERKLAEDALRHSEERFQLATASGEMYSWELDMASLEFQYSDSASNILGLSTATLPANLSEMMQLIHEDDQERVRQELEQATKYAHTYHLTFRMKKTDSGKYPLWLEKHARILRDQQGKAKRIIGIAQNITEKKIAEQALKKAKEQAEISAKAKEEFLSTMSHEIRTPLNAINGLTNLMLEKNPRPDQKENLNTLKFSTHNLLALINDILDFSKIEAGKVELENVDYQLSTLIESIRLAHTPLAEEKGNRLHFHIDENVPDILRNDPHKLAQVLNNLVSNANKFTQQGDIQLNISLLKRDKGSVWLNFELEDNGIGIPEDKIHKIFDKFTQADSSTVRRYGGTGLGLSITKSLLQLMGSEIFVESKEGKGSLFTFVLKQEIGQLSNLSMKQKEDPPTDARQGDVQFKELKVLLVEDVEINRLVIMLHLKEWWNLQVDEVINGKEALEMAQRNRYDLILMDKRMPEMDGIEACWHIRKLNDHYAQVPIIILTADAAMKDEVQEDGSRLYDLLITKPFDPVYLMNAISSLLIKAKATQQVPVKENHLSPISANIFEPDFASAEKNFKDQKALKKEFYEKTLDALHDFKISYQNALEQNDSIMLEESMHKVKMIFKLLGLESFYQEIYKIRKQIKTGKSAGNYNNKEIDKGLDEVLEKIGQHLSDL